MPTRMEFLATEHDRVRAGIEQIESQPAGENGDLSEEQRAQSAALFARATEIGTELAPLIERHRSLNATAAILAGLDLARGANGSAAAGITHGPGPTVTDVSPGEYFASYARAVHPENMNRAADLQAHVDRFRTVATMTTADTPSILPKPILGPVINFIDSTRYVVPSFTPRPMPDKGKQFSRPRITQHVTVGEQSAELAELTSQKMVLAGDDVTKRTFGGSLQVSQQDLDWTEPAALDLIFQDFADIYSKVTDAAAAASLIVAASGTVAWTATSTGTVLSSFVTAATSVYAASSALPTDLWVSLDVGLALGVMTTTVGDLVFPTIGSGVLNITDPGLGMNGPLGLRLHVCPNLPASTRIMGNRAYAEWYEQRNGFFSVAFPSALKIELAYAGYVTNYFRSEGFVRLV